MTENFLKLMTHKTTDSWSSENNNLEHTTHRYIQTAENKIQRENLKGTQRKKKHYI